MVSLTSWVFDFISKIYINSDLLSRELGYFRMENSVNIYNVAQMFAVDERSDRVILLLYPEFIRVLVWFDRDALAYPILFPLDSDN